MEDLKRKDLIPQTIDLNYSLRAFVKTKPQNKEFKSIKKGGEKQWVTGPRYNKDLCYRWRDE